MGVIMIERVNVRGRLRAVDVRRVHRMFTLMMTVMALHTSTTVSGG